MIINIQKRVIAMVLVVALLPCLLAVPAKAEEVDDLSSMFQVLDYGYPIGYKSNYISLSPVDTETRFTIRYANPGGHYLYYYDIIFRTDDTSPEISSGYEWLTVVSLGNGYYRAYGRQDRSSGNCYFHFNYDDGTYIEILSFKVSNVQMESYDTSVRGQGIAYASVNKTLNIHYYSGSSLIQTTWNYSSFEDYSSNGYDGSYYMNFSFDEWEAYDYVDINLSIFAKDVTSVSAYFGGDAIPFEVSTYDNGTGSSIFVLAVRLDLTGLDRGSGNVPYITVTGTGFYEGTNAVTVRYANGYVLVPEPSTWSYWFTQLGGWISAQTASLISGLETLGSNVSLWISSQTASFLTGLDTLGTNIDTWIKAQTESLRTRLGTVISTINDLGTNIQTWIAEQTDSLMTRLLTVCSYIQTWGQNIVDALTPDANTDDFQNAVDNQGDKLEDIAGSMGQVARPDVNTAVPDMGQYVDYASIATIVAPIWEIDYFLFLLMASLSITVISVIIYGGKR